MSSEATREAKQALLGEFAGVARALGHPARLDLLERLAQGEATVEALAERTGLTVANDSQHLQQLKRSGLVATRRAGKYSFYRLADSSVLDLLAALQNVAEANVARVGELLRHYFASPDDLAPVDRQRLVAQAEAGEVTVLDVRPADEFAQGHLPGAVNIPLAELDERLDELPGTGEIVAYCRGPYCVLSHSAIEVLRARGYQARRLPDGVVEWRAAGMPVAE